MQPMSFFFDHIGDTLLRGTTPIEVTEDNYLKLYQLQSPGYTFSEYVRVHKAVDNTCVSCEG